MHLFFQFLWYFWSGKAASRPRSGLVAASRSALKSSIKSIRQQSLQKGKDAHHDCDFQPVLFGGKFEMGLLITESADIVMNEILEQVDYKVGEEGDNNQVNTGTVHTYALF